jgi:predicted RNA binding protein YcfA (HicA-like mRNA interferase family)
MTEPVPIYAQQAYAVLYNRFADQPFNSNYLAWFLGKSMVKKTLHVLEKKGWIQRVKKGSYVCVRPDETFRAMVQFRVPRLLEEAGKPYVYTGASAVEVWIDFIYVQRSWEHSPYFIKVLRGDVVFWTRYFREHRVNVFVREAKPSIGEFVVLFPEGKLKFDVYKAKPVDKLKEVVRFCERNIELFEYPLAYLKSKFAVETKVRIDERVLDEAVRVV